MGVQEGLEAWVRAVVRDELAMYVAKGSSRPPRLATCEECGKVFLARDKRQRFCPGRIGANGKRGRSLCSGVARTRRHYRKAAQ